MKYSSNGKSSNKPFLLSSRMALSATSLFPSNENSDIIGAQIPNKEPMNKQLYKLTFNKKYFLIF